MSDSSAAPSVSVSFPSDSSSVLTEGSARIPFNASEGVFYNKVQVFNRDLSILIIRMFSEVRHDELTRSSHSRSSRSGDVDASSTAQNGIRIFEALSATGLRSIRYYKEIPHIDSILVNDLDPNAVKSIRQNIEFNGIPTDKLIPNEGDANIVMYMHRASGKQFDVVDLDPYGAAAEFLDAAVQSVSEGGLLCVTCTDKAVLAGNHGETCFAKYGAYSLRGRFCHEMAVRILLYSISQAAARYKRYIVPLLSLSIDFYVRVFVRVYTSPSKVKYTASKMANVYACNSCDSYWLQRIGRVHEKGNSLHFMPGSGPPVGKQCEVCEGSFRVGGPIWADGLHDPEFVGKALEFVSANEDKFATAQRIIGTLSLAKDELPNPLYLTLSGICHTIHVTQPKLPVIRSALLNGGYQISQAHSCPDALKTNAPIQFIWDIFREYAKEHPFNEKNVPAGSPARKILANPPEAKIDFTLVAESDMRSRSTGVAKFLPNPEANWGPKARAKKRKPEDQEVALLDENGQPLQGADRAIKAVSEELVNRSRAMQGKRKKAPIIRDCVKFFRTGACPFGDKCKYRHVTPEQKAIEDKEKTEETEEKMETNAQTEQS